ncbi:peptidoglycan-binding protein [Streptomyces sp. NPDC050610]|uniref:peptidoglycan-binding protein n=1 Tax=Streptomyces sp. NPDC050610 TaxID=3157097 RepID=UPI00341BFA14
MSMPVFEEFDPPGDCACGGCVQRRRALLHAVPARDGGHPAAHGARRAVVLVAAAGTVLGGGAGAAIAAGPAPSEVSSTDVRNGGAPDAPADATPQGRTGALYGADSEAAGGRGPVMALAVANRTTTRDAILNRAQHWVNQQVPYSMSHYWSDGYRQDCSGFVSMAWNLGSNQWTGSLSQFGTRISKSQLQPGDILLFHNAANPGAGSHVTVFGGWANSAQTRYIAYEQTRPHTLKRSTPYAYWNNSSRYVAYRYNGVVGGGSGNSGGSAAFPGAGSFGPGAYNSHVTRLGQLLVQRGGGKFYSEGPGPRWSEADRRATQAFQKAQGWSGGDADGIPGRATWDYLVNGKGKNIGGSGGSGNSGGNQGGNQGGNAGNRAPAYPGAAKFRPGQSNPYVAQLGKQLVKKGYGKHYSQGPGPRWSESDRRNVEAFQRAQGWGGRDADGYPGPETWRRLFA